MQQNNLISKQKKSLITIITNNNLVDHIIPQNKNVLVYFTATWCGPCKKYSTIINRIAIDYKKKIKILKVDVDQNKELCDLEKISSVPTTFIYNKNKNKIHNIKGYLEYEQLSDIINKI